jgi:hypothetical protein
MSEHMFADGGRTVEAELPSELGVLHEAIERLDALDAGGLDDRALHAAVVAVQRERARLAGAAAGLLVPHRAALFDRDEAMLINECVGLRFFEARRLVQYWSLT